MCRIATGEIEETFEPPPRPDADTTAIKQRTSAAGKARSASMTREQRTALAKSAAAIRWNRKS